MRDDMPHLFFPIHQCGIVETACRIRFQNGNVMPHDPLICGHSQDQRAPGSLRVIIVGQQEDPWLQC